MSKMDTKIDQILFTINDDDEDNNRQKDGGHTIVANVESSSMITESKMLLSDDDKNVNNLLLYDSIVQPPTATLEISSTMIINESSKSNNDGQNIDKIDKNDENLINVDVDDDDDGNIKMDYHFNPLYVISDRNSCQQPEHCSIQQQDQESLSIRNNDDRPIYLSSTSSTTFGQEFFQSPPLPPNDQYGLIYISLVMAGIGFLLPYNSFMIAVDYFQQRFPDTTIIFDMSTTYIVITFFTVIIQNLFVEIIPFRWRLNFGYLISLLFMMFAVIWEIWLRLGTYLDNLIIISIIAVGCSIQQSTFYGYTSMLPKR